MLIILQVSRQIAKEQTGYMLLSSLSLYPGSVRVMSAMHAGIEFGFESFTRGHHREQIYRGRQMTTFRLKYI